MQAFDLLKDKTFDNTVVKKVANLKTEQLGVDTYYFQPGQVLAYHKHPGSDQVFFFLEGEGKFYLEENGNEQVINVHPGMVVLAPADVLHKLENTGLGPLVATQCTKLPATIESK